MNQLALPSLLVLFSVSPTQEGADPEILGFQTRAAARIEAFRGEQHIPGMAVTVARDGELLFSRGFGLANVELGVPATPTTRFRVGSISKTLTSIALARLQAADRLDLDFPVQEYVPTFPEKAYPITTRQLAGHLSGLPHYDHDDFINTVHYDDVTAALAKFQDRPLLFEPGERFSYSSFGWNLISVVVENASGVEFLEYMEQAVFEPLGMKDTLADQYAEIIPRRTAFYVYREGGITNAPAIDNSDVWAGGGFLSTTEDLARFGHGVIAGPLLDDAQRDLLFAPMETNSGQSTGYGLGWVVGWGTPQTFGHGGSHVGATAELVVIPETGMVLVALSNSNNQGLGKLLEELAGDCPE